MTCPYCGTRQKQKGVFCENCGLRLVRKSPKAVLRRFLRRVGTAIGRIPKKVLVPVVILLVLAVAALILVPILTPEKYVMTETSFRAIYDETSNETTVVFGTDALAAKAEGRVRDYKTSLRGDRAVLLTESGVLYLCSPDSMALLAEGVTSFTIAADGDGVAYRDDLGQLYRKHGAKTVEVARDVTSEFCLSPDGKTLAYKTEDGAVYTFDGKRSVRQDADGTPIFVTNGCRRLYHVAESNGTWALFLNGKRIASNVFVTHITLTRDGSEIAFLTAEENGCRLMLSDGSAPVTLCSVTAGSDIPLLLRAGTARMTRSIGKTQVVTAASLTFRETFFRAGSELYYLNDDFTTEHLGTANVSSGIACGEKYLYYVRAERGTLCRIALDERQNAEVLETGVKTFTVTKNEKSYYYVTQDDVLYYVRAAGSEPARVRGEIETVCTVGRRTLFSNTDGFLYAASGKSAKQIAEDISKLTLSDGTVFYEHDDGNVQHVSASRDGKNFITVFPAD